MLALTHFTSPWMKKMDKESVKADMEESEYKEKCRTSKGTRSSAFARNLPRYAIQTIVANGQTSARHTPLLSMGGQDYHGLDSVSTTLRAQCQYSTSQRKSPLAGIDSPESERVPLAMMPRKPSSVTL